ncbi:unnamed protein product [Eretmochelys imbricata]
MEADILIRQTQESQNYGARSPCLTKYCSSSTMGTKADNHSWPPEAGWDSGLPIILVLCGDRCVHDACTCTGPIYATKPVACEGAEARMEEMQRSCLSFTTCFEAASCVQPYAERETAWSGTGHSRVSTCGKISVSCFSVENWVFD